MPELILPSVQYKESFIEAMKEFQSDNSPRNVDLNLEELRSNFESYIQKLENESQGIGLPEGYLPHTVYWLVDNGEFIGKLDIRHELNDQLEKIGGHIGYEVRPSKRRRGYGKLILELGLKKAKELGLNDVLITCDVGNIGSQKIIESNGGKLAGTEPAGEGLPDKCRYWITVK